MQHTPVRHARSKRLLSLLLALVLVLGLIPGFPLLGGETASAHWADTYMDEMVGYGFIQANHDPDTLLTRAEFMAIVNRAYGYTQSGPTPFEDIQPTDWYYDDVRIAYNARYMNGTSGTTASPNDTLNRETAATILGRNMMLKESEGEILDFFDARDISSWARGTIKSSLEHYLVNGYDDGTFQPKKEMTWGEMAAMVTRIVGTPIQEPGDYALGGVYGNVTISSEGVTLRDSIISGDLYVTGGVGLGDIKLENVTVLGRIIASGTGESENGQASIVLRNVVADELLVDNLNKNFVTVQVDGVTEIGKATVRTDSYLEDNTPEGLGLKNISLEGDYGTRLDLAGRIENVSVKTPGAQVNVAKGTVASMTVDEMAPDTNVNISRGTEVKVLNLDTGAYVSGDGDIKELYVNAEGAIVTMLPEKVHIRPGITAIIHNQIMDSTAAEEASRSPMLLSGYPLANDVSPTSFQAVFAANKKGTVYWAVSPISDGSVDTEDLIHPPTYGGISVAKGSVAIPAAEELVGATVGTPASASTGNNTNNTTTSVLTPGGSYYLAAVFVDDRGEQSPTKVIALTLPDGSVPAFAEGYPYMSLVSTADAQVTVMPTKDCILYYALLPEGAQAPTENDFKSGSVSGNLGLGTRSVTKNVEDVFSVNDRTLEEETTYNLYLWLRDADGANKSEIYGPITFTTPDETRPEFNPEPYLTAWGATNADFSFGLTEAGTVYWVAVEEGNSFPRPRPGQTTIALTDENAFLQVINGVGEIAASGNVKVTVPGQLGNIKITGLKEETAYTLYYLAVDLAGNQSYTIKTYEFNTKDESKPTVTQSFDPDPGPSGRPSVDTAVILTFSENVQFYTNDPYSRIDTRSFWTLQKAVNEATGSSKAQAQLTLAEALAATIHFYELDEQGNKIAVEPEDGVSYTTEEGKFTDSMLIDYTKAVVAPGEGKTYTVTFPSSALNLKSDHWYQFKVDHISDTSNERNLLIELTRTFELPKFHVELATVHLRDSTPDAAGWPYERQRVYSGDDINKLVPADGKTDADVKNADGTINWENVKLVAPEANDYASFFQMYSTDTATVGADAAFDVIFVQDRTARYQLYYRILNSSTGAVYPADSDYYKEENLLIKSKVSNEPDANGWIFLGSEEQSVSTNGPNSNGDYFRTLSLSANFIKSTTSATLPRLVNMKANAVYEFALVLISVSDNTDSTQWNGAVNFEAGVVEGDRNYLLNEVGEQKTKPADWLKIAGESPTVTTISRYERRNQISPLPEAFQPYEELFSQCFIALRQTFNSNGPLQFSSDYPTINNIKSSRATLNVSLNTEETGAGFYYRVAKVTGTGDAAKSSIDTTVYEHEDGTALGSSDTRTGVTRQIKQSEVPYTWTNMPEGIEADPIKSQPDLAGPSSGRIAADGIFVSCDPSKVTPVTITEDMNGEALEASTLYYVYIVLARDGDNHENQVYIFQFTTDEAKRPETNIEFALTPNGDVDHKSLLTLLTHNIAIGSYVLLTEEQLSDSQYGLLLKPFSDLFIAEGEGADLHYRMLDRTVNTYDENGGWLVPDGYIWKRDSSGKIDKTSGDKYTILEILCLLGDESEDYSQEGARKRCYTDDTSDYYIPNPYEEGDTRGYTAFDVYADNITRTSLYNTISSPTTYLFTEPSVRTETEGTNVALPWTWTWPFNETDTTTINSGTYYILFCARDAGAAKNNTGSYDSFRARRYQVVDTNAPDIRNEKGGVTLAPAGIKPVNAATAPTGGYTAQITVNFDKEIFIGTGTSRKTLAEVVTDSPTLSGNVVPTITDEEFKSANPPAQSLTANRSSTGATLVLDIKGIEVDSGTFQVNMNTFRNRNGTPAGNALQIELVSDEDREDPRYDPADDSKHEGQYWHKYDVYGHLEVTWEGHPYSPWKLGQNTVLYSYYRNEPPEEDPSANSIAAISLEALNSSKKDVLKGTETSGYTLALNDSQNAVNIANVQGGPDNAVKYEWTSTDPNIVSVTGSGATPQLTATGIGTATVNLKITGADGETSTQRITTTVTGSPTVSGAKVNDTSGSFTIKQSGKSGVDYEVTWTASSSSKNAKLDIGLGKLTKTTVTWEVVSGSSVQFSVGSSYAKQTTGATAMLKYMNNGTTTIRVTAGTVTKVIEVTAKNASGPNLNLAVK